MCGLCSHSCGGRDRLVTPRLAVPMIINDPRLGNSGEDCAELSQLSCFRMLQKNNIIYKSALTYFDMLYLM